VGESGRKGGFEEKVGEVGGSTRNYGMHICKGRGEVKGGEGVQQDESPQ